MSKPPGPRSEDAHAMRWQKSPRRNGERRPPNAPPAAPRPASRSPSATGRAPAIARKHLLKRRGSAGRHAAEIAAVRAEATALPAPSARLAAERAKFQERLSQHQDELAQAQHGSTPLKSLPPPLRRPAARQETRLPTSRPAAEHLRQTSTTSATPPRTRQRLAQADLDTARQAAAPAAAASARPRSALARPTAEGIAAADRAARMITRP